jgi:hypothetical protein
MVRILPEFAKSSRRFSLSPRESAGVRGKNRYEEDKASKSLVAALVRNKDE